MRSVFCFCPLAVQRAVASCMANIFNYDVAIVGGGPAGSTAGTLLKKYDSSLRVGIFEREKFPRDHIGESQLPPISKILVEMGCWDKVEAANFPIKIGTTYRWGRSPELWHFEFLPFESFVDESRPAKFEGQRRSTSFQVDRSVYDDILLRHAESMGCVVHEEAKISGVLQENDTISRLILATGEEVTARFYVDASGTSGVIRRAMGVECDCPTALKNIAIWDYWQNTEWAASIGVGGTRVQILTVRNGWIWFIPLGPTRTSIGLVMPAAHYKKSGKSPQELYEEALQEESIIAGLIKNATCEGKLKTTRDWSSLSRRQAGKNWFLAGESSGFADPILSAGMTMAHLAGRDAAYSILELNRQAADWEWLMAEYELRQSRRIKTHIRFADYWYSANSQFKDLQDFTSELAKSAGLDLTPGDAWAWIAQGGFIDEELGFGTAGVSLSFLQNSGEFLREIKSDSPLSHLNVFTLNLTGATWKDRATYRSGRVSKEGSYVRQGRILPLDGIFDYIVHLLQRTSRSSEMFQMVKADAQRNSANAGFMASLRLLPQALEAMILDGWVTATFDSNEPHIPLTGSATEVLRWNAEIAQVSERR